MAIAAVDELHGAASVEWLRARGRRLLELREARELLPVVFGDAPRGLGVALELGEALLFSFLV